MAILKYKDPTTGDWIELSNAVGDTLPIGTIVEYDGTTVPTNWEKVNDYSTEEVKTGETWIDGKPIYRKVISLTASTSTKSLSISSIISNVDSIWINCGKSFYKIAAGGSGIISDWEVSGARFRAVIDIGTLYYACSGSGYSQAEITLEYTKTTD